METEVRTQVQLCEPQENDAKEETAADNSQRLTYSYSLSDTYLHQCFGDAKARQIIQICHGTFSKAFVFWNVIFYGQLFFISRLFYDKIPLKSLRILFWIFVILAQIVNVVLICLYALSVNRKLFEIHQLVNTL